jgi:alanine racemase
MSAEPKIAGRPIWMEVHTDALEANFRAIRKHLDSSPATNGSHATPGKLVKILAVVKGGGYGHGTVAAAKAFGRAGADWFGVTSADEGAELREAGVRKPILVLAGFWHGEEKRLIENNLTPAVTDCTQLRDLERVAARASRTSRGGKRLQTPFDFHLKIDSGMNRLGIAPSAIECVVRTLEKCPHLRLSGTFTHLASSEDFASEQSDEQMRVFHAALDNMRRRNLSPGIVHVANSAAVIHRPETWENMVRPGAILYGYHQNFNPAQLHADAVRDVPLQPAVNFCARVVAIKEVAAGGVVGYNARFRATQPTRVAIVCAGYADGLPRTLSNRGRMILRGQFAPIVGTVSMDLTAIDVTAIEGVEIGDVATVYGTRETGGATPAQAASDVARLLGTATSELLCAISKRVPRIVLH